MIFVTCLSLSILRKAKSISEKYCMDSDMTKKSEQRSTCACAAYYYYYYNPRTKYICMTIDHIFVLHRSLHCDCDL